jgi:hypothetical protein
MKEQIDTISKEDFLEAAAKGWEKYEYAHGSRFLKEDGTNWDDDRCSEALLDGTPGKVASCCILGAATLGLYGKPSWGLSDKVCNSLPEGIAYAVARISNNAGSKEAALTNVAALDWTRLKW